MILVRTNRLGLGLALAMSTLLASLASLSLAACAESSGNAPLAAPEDSVRAPSDAGDAASPSNGGDAADGDVPAVPCAVGHVCRVSSPLASGSVSSISGRSKTDIWAAGSLGLTMRWDGTAWTELGTTEVPPPLTTLSSISLTPDEAWGVAGAKIMRRGVDPASVRSFELFDPDRAPAVITALGNGDVYVGCVVGGFSGAGATGALLKMHDFDNGLVELVPPPTLAGDARPQPMSIRAMSLVADETLWVVGDRGAVARYPVAPLGPGVVLPLTTQANLFAAWGVGDQLWAAGESGTLLHFDGAEWHEEESGTSARLNALFGFSPSDVWAAGDEGTLLHFDGKTWSSIPIQSYGGSLRTIWGATPDDVWFGGEQGLFHWGSLP